jgi:hypothetical protein
MVVVVMVVVVVVVVVHFSTAIAKAFINMATLIIVSSVDHSLPFFHCLNLSNKQCFLSFSLLSLSPSSWINYREKAN